MNVEFRCPTCGSRFMHPPAGGVGAKIRRTCPREACASSPKGNRYTQTEAFGVDVVHAPPARRTPRLDFIDEDRGTGSREGKPAPESVEGGGTVGSVVNKDDAILATLSHDEGVNYMRDRILELTDKRADGRLGYDSLKEELYRILDEKQPMPAVDTTMRDGVPEEVSP